MRRLNPAEVYPPINDNYSQVVRCAGDLVFISGLVGLDREGELVSREIDDQTRAILDNIELSLAAADAGKADLVQMRVYTTNIDAYLGQASPLIHAWYGDDKPTSSLLEVSRLAKPEYLIEIDAVAVVDR